MRSCRSEIVFTSFGLDGSVPTSNTKILPSSRRPAQRKRRSSVKPMWCASPCPATDTVLTTLPYFFERGLASTVTSLSDPSPQPSTPSVHTCTKSSCPLIRPVMYGELQVSSAATAAENVTASSRTNHARIGRIERIRNVIFVSLSPGPARTCRLWSYADRRAGYLATAGCVHIRGLEYDRRHWGRPGFDADRETERCMPRTSHLVNPLEAIQTPTTSVSLSPHKTGGTLH